MRVIIAGSRDITRPSLVWSAIREAKTKSGIIVTEVVSGGARGVDRLGERYARKIGIPIKPFIPNWYPLGIYDPTAGFRRNRKMAEYADALIALWDGSSPGTKNMIYEAREHDLKVFFKMVKGW